MLRNVKVRMLAVLVAGALLGYAAASGKLNFFQKVEAAPPGVLGVQLLAPAGLAPAQTGDVEEVIAFKVRLPADALLEIDGSKTTSTGEIRTFRTPPLKVGGNYSYTLKATVNGKEVTRTIHLAHGVDNTFDLRAEFRLGTEKHPVVDAEKSKGFSFAVHGDSRTMLYVPYKEGQEEKIDKLLVDVFSLVLPEKVAEEVVKRDVKLTFDPDTKELVHVQMPFASKTEVMFLTVDKGWVTEASVEDVKLLPGVRRTIFRLGAGEWVTREMVRDVQTGRARFLVSTGDIVWWGKQGITLEDSPFWKRVNETLLSKLPAPDEEMKAAGLEGRYLPSVGNHEVWGDPKIEGVLSAVPYLKKLGVSADRLIYKYDFKGVRFIYLWTGKYDYRSPSDWDAERPVYEVQMKQLKEWLDEAKTKGIKKAFIVFHNPVFARSGMGGIPEPRNPHKVIASYAKDFELVVLNGHVHTTEIYDVDGVKYLLLGGGGAEQDPILPGRTKIKVPADYPPDLYWKGQPPKEEYNYLLVDVEPGQKTKFTLKRFRPWSAKPFETVELFGSSK